LLFQHQFLLQVVVKGLHLVEMVLLAARAEERALQTALTGRVVLERQTKVATAETTTTLELLDNEAREVVAERLLLALTEQHRVQATEAMVLAIFYELAQLKIVQAAVAEAATLRMLAILKVLAV
jgi:hypothetical protein